VQEVVAQEPVASPKVVNLMEALKQSVNAVSERKKSPAKSQLATMAPKRKRA
jgi:non-homologous end joining protein Ku